MWIVRLALSRPYTFVVMAILIAILGGSAITTMAVDIFPFIDIPVVSVLWVYTGLSPEEMEKRVVTDFERSLTSNVNDIEHIESQAYSGYAVVRIYFHPNVKVDMAVAQVTATMNTSLRQMPPGMFPANILKYDAASVPILQLGLSSKTLREQEIFDIGNNFIRTPLGTGAGRVGVVSVRGQAAVRDGRPEPRRVVRRQLSPIDVSNALNQQNLILPAGTAKMANTEYQVRVNSSPVLLGDLNNLPIKTVNGATVYIKDVAQVRDGFQVQNNIVRTNGSRGVLITVTRNGNASTLAIVNAVKAALPRILANVPPELKVTALADQSVFVRASIQGVVREAAIAAGLTGLMILLFLGSWRSTLIVCISIPLSILASLAILNLLGHTINVMTLGGLALAVGILVDDATVEIENTHRNLAMRKPLIHAVLDGASQIAVPTFVATISICIVFVPVFLLTGTARYLFAPLALAVVFAMLASYLLSRTLVPTMMAYLLGSEAAVHEEAGESSAHARGLLHRGHRVFNRVFEALRYRYMGLLDWSLRHRGRVLLAFTAFAGASLCLVMLIGEDFFPSVDSGQMRLHARGRAGTRIEETEARFAEIERDIRSVIPARELDMLIDNIGIPNSWPSHRAGRHPDHLQRRRRDPDFAEQGGARVDTRLRSDASKAAAEELPGHGFLLPARGHHQPDSELRAARADRPAGGRTQCRGQLPGGAEAGGADRENPRRCRRPRAPGDGTARHRRQRGSREGVANGIDTTRRHEQHADLSQRQLDGRAELLDELDQRSATTTSACRRRNTASTRSTRCCALRSRRPAPR